MVMRSEDYTDQAFKNIMTTSIEWTILQLHKSRIKMRYDSQKDAQNQNTQQSIAQSKKSLNPKMITAQISSIALEIRKLNQLKQSILTAQFPQNLIFINL